MAMEIYGTDVESSPLSSVAKLTLKDWRLDPISPSGTTVVNIKTGEQHDYTFASSIVRGCPHPPFIKADLWELQKANLRFRPGDVFVTTMSKCGTTLAEQIVLLLLNGGKTEELNPLHKNTFDPRSGNIGKIWAEMTVVEGLGVNGESENTTAANACMGEGKARMSVEDFDSIPSPRILKTHAPRDLFLADDREAGDGSLTSGVKVIYVTRNPFDACVSCYYHPKPGVSPHSKGMPFDAFARLWLSKRVEFGGWTNHVKGWREEYESSSNNDVMLWISYEDLVGQPIESIEQIARFLKVDASSSLIERVAAGCKFDNVKKAAKNAIALGEQGDLTHLRRGVVGDWKNHFSTCLRAEFEQELSVKLSGVNLEYDIGEVDLWSPSSVSKFGEGGSCAKESNNRVPIEAKRLTDIKILGTTMIFYCILQTTLQYVNEFYIDDLRDKNGLEQPVNFPAVSLIIANVFNGVNGGLALCTTIFSGHLIRSQWKSAGHDIQGRAVIYFFVSIVIESIVTSGVLHTVAHRLFGATLDGNSWVEFIFHLGFTINVIVTGIFTIIWLGPQLLATKRSNTRPGWYPKIWEVVLAIILSILAILFTQLWVPFQPDPEAFDYREDHIINENRIVMVQGQVQSVLESVLLIPTVPMLFILGRLWNAIGPAAGEQSLVTYRISILAVALPLCANWIHFRCHDNLVVPIQELMGWHHNETIAAIRIVFHIPAWILAIGRLHYFRVLTEQKAGWPALDIFETICPGRDAFPLMMIFLYRATEGMTLSLLPSYFQDATETQNFHLDITDNTWLAMTVLSMFIGNAIGSVGLGWLMQKKGYRFAYIFACSSSAILLPLYMIRHTNASFLALRCISALIFPGPIVLSQVTRNTRHTHTGILKHVPMVTSLVWFNQGFWFGGAISNASDWTPSNVFFVSAAILGSLFMVLLVAFVANGWKASSRSEGAATIASEGPTDRLKAFDTESNIVTAPDDNDDCAKKMSSCKVTAAKSRGSWGDLWFEKMASFANGASFACHIALLGIQVTKLVDLDVYEYTTIISSLGTISTVLILSCFRFFSKKTTSFSIAIAYLGHIFGTAVLSIPRIYVLPQGGAVALILVSYSTILLSFFVMNLSCEVSLGQKSLKQEQQGNGKDSADGMQMGYIKSCLSIGKMFGASLVAFAFRFHPQLPLWILDGFLLVAFVIGGAAMFSHNRKLESFYNV